jgi:hypothetical protein
MIRASACALALFPLFALSAQDGEPRPKEPVAPRAPEKAYWKVTTRYKSGAPTADGEQQKGKTAVRTVRKEKQLIQEIMERDGTRFESYILGGLRLSDFGKKDTVVKVPPTDTRFPFYGDSDFARMGWLSMKHFKGVEEYKGRQVFVFRISGDDPDAVVPGPAVIMLDTKTQLPVAYADEELEETYEFMSPPSTAMVIPEVFQKRLVKELQYIQDLRRASGGG